MSKVSSRCDELVAVGWRTFAAKGRLESRFALPEFAANALRNHCAVWYNDDIKKYGKGFARYGFFEQ